MTSGWSRNDGISIWRCQHKSSFVLEPKQKTKHTYRNNATKTTRIATKTTKHRPVGRAAGYRAFIYNCSHLQLPGQLRPGKLATKGSCGEIVNKRPVRECRSTHYVWEVCVDHQNKLRNTLLLNVVCGFGYEWELWKVRA